MILLVDDNTKKIADEVLSMTKAGVVDVWEKVQQAAPELWKMVVRQKFLDGIECAAFGALALVVTSITFYYLIKKIKKGDASEEDIILAGATLVGLICVVAATVNAIDFMGNPSWWALKDILDLVRGH